MLGLNPGVSSIVMELALRVTDDSDLKCKIIILQHNNGNKTEQITQRFIYNCEIHNMMKSMSDDCIPV